MKDASSDTTSVSSVLLVLSRLTQCWAKHSTQSDARNPKLKKLMNVQVSKGDDVPVELTQTTDEFLLRDCADWRDEVFAEGRELLAKAGFEVEAKLTPSAFNEYTKLYMRILDLYWHLQDLIKEEKAKLDEKVAAAATVSHLKRK
ncbi:Hypothetical predicted protein [Cloeon dipterum]|uniref:Uncharacterized protein n=1 Tax=Cloeon dipterum TaxID=197152 RepID=A0A8S1DSI6_9INSE|nr:Hypothetical predicted protein [Cloeon dipterum]